jgi:head-tail adaptor
MVINGNTEAMIQIMNTTENEIGEAVENWVDVQMIVGWLDLQGEQTGRTNYNTKLQESTHVFVSDYYELDSRIKAENSRMVINGKNYDIMLIDDPMELHKQLEIFLKYTGGQ